MKHNNMELPKGKFTLHSFLLYWMIGMGFFTGECRTTASNEESNGKEYSSGKSLKQPIITSSQVSSTYKSFPNCSEIPWSDKNCILGPYDTTLAILSPSFFKQLCPHANGKFQVEGSCSLYISCYNGSMTVNQCKNSTFFNSHALDCSVSKNSQCEQFETGDRDFLNSFLKEKLIDKEGIKEQSNPLVVKPKQKSPISVALNTIGKENDGRNDEKFHDGIWRSSMILSETKSNVSSSRQIHKELRSEKESKSESRYPKGAELLHQVPMCTNSSNDIFSHPQSCEHFIQCASGKAYIRMCAPGKVFHPTRLVCDWATNVPQCNHHSSNHVEKKDNRVKRSTADNGNNIVLETNALLTPMSQIHKRQKRDLPQRLSSRKCAPSENYIQPHAIYCNKFEICSNGRISEQACGVGALFNPLSSVCDFPYNVDCKSRIVDYSTYGCENNDKYITNHPEHCDKFIECDKGNLFIKNCPPSTVYNYEEEECDHVYKSKCREPISLEHDTDVNFLPLPRISRSSQPNSLNLACNFNYIAPHPQYCNKFVECEDRRIFIKSCGPGTVFNENIGQCDWAYNTRKPHDYDCSQYLHCERGVYTPKRCFGNTVFSPTSRKCVFSQLGADACRPEQVVPPPPAPS